MLSKQNILDYLSENKSDFKARFEVLRIGIFGSFAREQQDENSDIDILVEFGESAEIYDAKFEIAKIVGEHFGRDVDICRAKYLKSFAREKILAEAIYA